MPDAVTPSREGFRPDIEGLRGVAVLAVVLYHAGLAGPVGGYVGVDVFFVISGFLITGLLVRERERSGTIALLAFYARRARRLLPAAIVVLVATLVASINIVPPLDRPAVGLDAASAALSIGNIRFAIASGDYFASGADPSPFLHFWSLGVEEQFYLVWPGLILLVTHGQCTGRRIAIALLAVIAASFIANVIVTDAAANWAFYSLPTRAWQLGLGGLVAVGSDPFSRILGRASGLIGWLGLGAIGFAVLTFDAGLAYPGVAAVVPSVGAAALLAAGVAGNGSVRFTSGRLLGVAPLRFVGRISYSLYLVHWPIFVLVPIALGVEPGAAMYAGLVVVAIVAAWFSWAAIETPFRTALPRLARRPGRTVSLGLAAIAAVVVLAATPSMGTSALHTAAATVPDDAWVDGTATPSPAATPDQSTTPPTPASPSPSRPTMSPRASATPTATPPPTPRPPLDVAARGTLPADVQPAVADARSDEERLRADGCVAFEPVTVPPDCVYGDPGASFTVALVGDSHAAQWFPALARVAKHEDWRIVTFVKVACPFIDMPVRNIALQREYRECAAFDAATLIRLRALKPDLTLVSMSRFAIHTLDAADDTVAAKGAAIARMVDRIPGRTAIIVDTPYAGIDVPACLSAHPSNIDACAIPRWRAFSGNLGAIESIAAKISGAGLIDLTRRICVGKPCSVVVNDRIVFRDIGHLTATFSRSLAPGLDAAIAALGDL